MKGYYKYKSELKYNKKHFKCLYCGTFNLLDTSTSCNCKSCGAGIQKL